MQSDKDINNENDDFIDKDTIQETLERQERMIDHLYDGMEILYKEIELLRSQVSYVKQSYKQNTFKINKFNYNTCFDGM